jgi:hypothetical protein
MSVLTYRTYSAQLPKESLKHVYNVLKTNTELIVRFAQPVPYLNDPDKFCLKITGSNWEEIQQICAKLNFAKTLNPDSWDNLESKFNAWRNFSCQPTRKKLPEGHVFDEDKSVRWNREQVQKHNQTVDDEVISLNNRKNEIREEMLAQVVVNIQSELRGAVSRKKALAIWEYAYNQAEHRYNLDSIINELSKVLSLMAVIYDFEDWEPFLT